MPWKRFVRRARRAANPRRWHSRRSVPLVPERFFRDRKRLRDDVGLLQAAPDVDHRLAVEVELAIGGMRSAENEEIAARDHLVERKQYRIGGDERIGGEHRGGLAL